MKKQDYEKDPKSDKAEGDLPGNEGQAQEANPGDIRLSRSEYDALKARLAELEGLREKLLLSAADFENAKKRLGREKEEFLKFGQENLIRAILPAIDNFERALAHAGSTSSEDAEDPKAGSLKALIAGVQMVHKQLLEALKGQGLRRIESVNHPFDPHLHEAVGFLQEEGREDCVAEEVAAGYLLHDRLLRAAKVRVRISPSRGSAPGETQTGSAGPVSEEKPEEIT